MYRHLWCNILAHILDSQYLADKNLSERTAFKWLILRPGSLADEPGTGKASIGRTHLTPSIAVRNIFCRKCFAIEYLLPC